MVGGLVVTLGVGLGVGVTLGVGVGVGVTLGVGRPEETVNVTVLPALTFCPDAGEVDNTTPAGTSLWE